MSTLNEISQMVVTGQIRTIKAKVQQALDEGIGAQEILDGGLLPGINEIGEKFARNEVFVPNVLLAAKVMNMGVEVIQPLLAAGESTKVGTAVVGTVKGDLHDIGKSLVATQLAVNGYEVVDLGTDVPTNKFIDTAVAENADIIAVSSLLTTSQYYMEELIHRLTNEGKRDKFHIAIGGGPINPDYAEKIGADGYSRTADLAVKMADRLMAAAPQSGLISEV